MKTDGCFDFHNSNSAVILFQIYFKVFEHYKSSVNKMHDMYMYYFVIFMISHS